MRFLFSGLGLVAAVLTLPLGRADPSFRPTRAPPFPTSDPSHWIGTPQSWGSLKGRVVLLDVWTFG